MKPLAKLAVKIVALYFISFGLLSSIGFITTIVLQVDNISKDLSVMQAIIVPLCYLSFGVVLWIVSGFISSIIVGKTDEVPKEISLGISFEMLLRSLIIIVGIVVIINAIPKIISGYFVILSLNEFGDSALFIRQKSTVIENIIKLIIAVFLVFGFKGISKIICKLGNLDINKGEIAESSKDDKD